MTTTTIIPETPAPRPRRKRRRGGLGLYQSQGIWRLDAVIRGRRLRQSFGRIDERLAVELATAARANALRGAAGILPTTPKDCTVEHALKVFTERHVATLRPSTQRVCHDGLKRLAAYFKGRRLSEIGPLSIEGYRKQRTANHTRARVRSNREITLLRTIYSRMIAWNLFGGDNPIRTVAGRPTVGRYPESRGRERVLTLAEEARLLAVLPQPYSTLLLLGLHTGVRLRSEGLSLVWGSVDLERRRLTVQPEHAKNGERRTIPLSAPLVAALTALRPVDATPTDPVFTTRDGRPLRELSSVLWRAARKAHVHGISPHTTRHTWASRFVQAGGDLRALQTLGGWKTLALVVRYSHTDETHAAAALDRMVATFPTPTATAEGSAERGEFRGDRGEFGGVKRAQSGSNGTDLTGMARAPIARRARGKSASA